MYTLIEDRSSWQDEIATLLLGYVPSVTTVRAECPDELFPSLAARHLMSSGEILDNVNDIVSGYFTDTTDFAKHSKAAVGNYDSLLFYTHYNWESGWELEEDTVGGTCRDPDWMMTDDGVIDPSKCYYSMVVPVIGGIPDYSRWSFAPDWAGYPRVCNDYLEEEKYDDLMPQVRGKRQSIEKKRGFRGNPNMRMAA